LCIGLHSTGSTTAWHCYSRAARTRNKATVKATPFWRLQRLQIPTRGCKRTSRRLVKYCKKRSSKRTEQRRMAMLPSIVPGVSGGIGDRGDRNCPPATQTVRGRFPITNAQLRLEPMLDECNGLLSPVEIVSH